MCTFLFSCSRFSSGTYEQNRSRLLAKALQSMTESAEIGSLFEMKSQFTEREPNANAYLGSLLYDRYCQKCHGKASKSNLVNRASAMDAESEYYIIRYGIKGTSGDMQGFRNRLTKFQILDVMAFIQHDPQTLAQMIKILDEYSMGTVKPPEAERSESEQMQDNSETQETD